VLNPNTLKTSAAEPRLTRKSKRKMLKNASKRAFVVSLGGMMVIPFALTTFAGINNNTSNIAKIMEDFLARFTEPTYSPPSAKLYL
jgi:hypothetical protein